MSRKRLLVIAPLAIAGIFAFVAIGGFVVQLLWNWLLPPLFGWREITFWQGVGLLALCRILFGGFRLHGAAHRSDVRRSWWIVWRTASASALTPCLPRSANDSANVCANAAAWVHRQARLTRRSEGHSSSRVLLKTR